MTWVEQRFWRAALIAQISSREHRAANPWRITLTTTWPRALLQCLFFTLLGRVVGDQNGQAYTFVGSVAVIMALFTLGDISDVPMRDRWSATFFRLRLGRVPIPVIYTIRAWPLGAEAVAMAAICILVVGLATGQADLAFRLIPLLPIYVLMVVTSVAAGLAVASIGLVGRAGNDVIVGNLSVYLTIAASGALIPSGHVAWLDTAGTVLPMRHGLQAIRNELIGDAWLTEVLTEVAVGIVWAVIAFTAYTVLARRARHTDHDKVT